MAADDWTDYAAFPARRRPTPDPFQILAWQAPADDMAEVRARAAAYLARFTGDQEAAA